jgi:hypothetical protein
MGSVGRECHRNVKERTEMIRVTTGKYTEEKNKIYSLTELVKNFTTARGRIDRDMTKP